MEKLVVNNPSISIDHGMDIESGMVSQKRAETILTENEMENLDNQYRSQSEDKEAVSLEQIEMEKEPSLDEVPNEAV